MRSYVRALCLVGLAALVVTAPRNASAQVAPAYAIKDLGGLGVDRNGFSYSIASALNTSGQVVGQSHTYDSYGNYMSTHSFLFDGVNLKDLGALSNYSPGASFSAATAINAAGQVIGVSSLYDGAGNYQGGRAFLSDGIALKNLGVLSTNSSGFSHSEPAAINGAGQIVGYSNVYDSAGTSKGTHAFLFDGVFLKDLGTLGTDTNGSGVSAATAINASGQVAGYSLYYDSAGNYSGVRAFLSDGVTLKNLGALSTDSHGYSLSYAFALNASGQVAGLSSIYDSAGNLKGQHAFLYDGAALTDIGAFGTDPAGSSYSYPIAINGAGQVTGYSNVYDSSGNYRGQNSYLFDGITLRNLGTLSTNNLGYGTNYPNAINNSGQVVGQSYAFDRAGNYIGEHGFLFDHGHLYDLDDLLPANSEWDIGEARDINDKGQITGTGSIHGQQHAFLLTPAPVDVSAPATTASLAGPAGSNGWYTGLVTVTLTAKDPDDAPAAITTFYSTDGGSTYTRYTTPVAVFGDGAHAMAFYSVDAAGNKEAAQSVTVNIDGGPPSIFGSRTPDANAAGWNNSNVIVSFTGSDSVSGIGTVTGPITVTTEGTGQSVTGTATDKAGNSASVTVSGINIDKTPPVIRTADVNVTAASVSGALVSFPTPSASDSLSGVAGAVVCSPPSGSSFPVGTSIVTCTVADAAGNLATATFKVNVTYSWSGILQPINTDGSSVFKQGSTIPVKFQLTGPSAGITNLIANLSYVQIGSAAGAVNEAVSTSAADTGNQFRYSGGQYIFNMSTKGMLAGAQYRLVIDLHDGVSRSVIIGLR